MKQRRRKKKQPWWMWTLRVTAKCIFHLGLAAAFFLIGFVEGLVLGIKDAQAKKKKENYNLSPRRRTVVFYKGVAKGGIGNG